MGKKVYALFFLAARLWEYLYTLLLYNPMEQVYSLEYYTMGS